MENYTVVVLAAGGGTRMNSDIPKVLHKICGKPMVSILIDVLNKTGLDDIIVVTGFKETLVRDELGDRVSYVSQKELLGTGHAVMQALPLLDERKGKVIVLCGDVPLISENTLKSFINNVEQSDADSFVITMDLENPFGYGRIIKDNTGRVIKIVEENTASGEEKNVTEVNSGIYCFDIEDLVSVLGLLSNDNVQGEYYLTEVIEKLNSKNKIIKTFKLKDVQEAKGINSREGISEAEKYLQTRIINEMISNGVTVVDPNLVYIEEDVVIGKDSIIEPFVRISRGARIGSNCVIRSFTEIKPNEVVEDSKVGVHRE